jgi:group I intron endonuclease
MRKKSGIYVITHDASGRQYVGQSQSIGDRWLAHKSSLRRGTSSNRFLQGAWNKYGEASFSFTVLEMCPPTDALICAREQYWIDLLKPVFNLAPVAGTNRGVKHPTPRSEEFRKKMGESKRGFKHSPETIELLREIQRNNPWRPSPEHIEKLRRIHTGKKLSAEHIEKTRQANLGRKQSPEEIARRSAALKGHSVSDETRAKIGSANSIRNMGKKQSAELIEKRIAPLRGRKRDPDVIAILHAGLRKSWEERAVRIKAIISANMHLNVTELCKLVGMSNKPVSRFKKELICQQAQQSGNEPAALDFRRKKASSSALPSTPPLQQNLPLG